MTQPRRVLYVSHTPVIGGAEHCLLDLLSELPDGVTPLAAVPAGPLGDELSRRGIAWWAVPATSTGLRPSASQLARGIAEALNAARKIRQIIRQNAVQLVHANSLRAAAVASLAAYPSGPPVLAHSHDSLPPSRLARLVERIATLRGAHVLALSRDSAESIGPTISRGRIHVVGNGIDLRRFDPGRIDRAQARARILPREAPTLAVIAQLTPFKAQDDAVRALSSIREALPEAQLLLVGSRKFSSPGSRYDNQGFEAELTELVRARGLEECVHFLGERADVDEVMRAIDVLLVPSWNEPFGRVMLEAMAMGTPLVATARGGPADVIEDGRTGLLVPPRDPDALARAALRLLAEEHLREQVTAAARDAVRRFELGEWASRVVELYARSIESSRRSTT